MSRIGKKPIPVPDGVKVQIEEAQVTVEGPKGTLTQAFAPELQVQLVEGQLLVERPNDERQMRSLHGLTRALLNNMVVGVTEGYVITLEISGTGYKAELQEQKLVLNLGFSHPVVVEPPAGVEFEVNTRANTVTVRGIDKQVVGQVAANIRAWRPVEPYLGKGIRYQGERVRRKAGKAGKV
ncbi:MAG TPA: 50S ribosomal protein L6 [Chloroflexi bacterium]|nr:50S ribosomal protein L6 [Chloroflexota bacterium]